MKTSVTFEGSGFPLSVCEHNDRPKLIERRVSLSASASETIELPSTGKKKSILVLREEGDMTVTVPDEGNVAVLSSSTEGISIPVRSDTTDVVVANSSSTKTARFRIVVY